MARSGLTVRAHAFLLAATMLTMVSVVLAQWHTGHMGNGRALGIGGLALAPLLPLLLRRRLLLACVGYWLPAVPLLLVFCAREGGLGQLLVWTGAESITFVEALARDERDAFRELGGNRPLRPASRSADEQESRS